MNNNIGNIVVVGDVHGDMNQFLYPLLYFLKHYNECSKIIYLGDYIDRGESNVYIYEIINGLVHHDKFIFLRGNHECWDSGTRNHINFAVNNNINSYIKTFMFDLYVELDLDIIHYDIHHNILFSHSPLSRPLQLCLDYNLAKYDKDVRYDYTYTDDQPHYNMEYRNIHGHTHYANPSEDLFDFFNSKSGMIGIDNDASYGCKYSSNVIQWCMDHYDGNDGIKPSWNILRKYDNQFTSSASFINHQPCESNVTWLVLKPNGECARMTKTIPFGSSIDYNQYLFDDIMFLLKTVTNDNETLREIITGINLNTSIHWFKQCLNTANVPRGEELNYISNLRNYNVPLICYFHDVPYELYKSIGVNVPKLPVHKLYYHWI